MASPRLRTVNNVQEPYPLGDFPAGFVHTVAGAISAALAVGRIDIEGKDWEQIFAQAIKAEWKPSNVGLDDILMPALSAAWGVKTVKNANPFTATHIRLISGRNSLAYSFSISDISVHDPAELGEHVLEIWNERVAALYQKYKTLRTVVLMKGDKLRKISIFEKPTIRFNAAEWSWGWNKNRNLVGRHRDGTPKFTWQPHGAQFTIHEDVPDNALNIDIEPPATISTEKLLQSIGFNESFYRIAPRTKL